jgi:hypothetical protein
MLPPGSRNLTLAARHAGVSIHPPNSRFSSAPTRRRGASHPPRSDPPACHPRMPCGQALLGRSAMIDLCRPRNRKTNDSASDYDPRFRQTWYDALRVSQPSDLREPDLTRLPQTKPPCMACRRSSRQEAVSAGRPAGLGTLPPPSRTCSRLPPRPGSPSSLQKRMRLGSSRPWTQSSAPGYGGRARHPKLSPSPGQVACCTPRRLLPAKAPAQSPQCTRPSVGSSRAPKNKLERGGSAYPLASVKKLTLLPAQDSRGGQASTR